MIYLQNSNFSSYSKPVFLSMLPKMELINKSNTYIDFNPYKFTEEREFQRVNSLI